MKELSIEEKAKAYDKFVEELKSKFKDFKVVIYNKNDLKKFFPELCESEDERIRKEIIEVIESLSLEKEYEYIAWLEKQGEIIKEWSEMKMNNIQTELQDMVDLKQKTEQGEQKPTVIIPKFRIGDEIKTDNEESLTITKIDEKGYWSGDLFICDFDEEVSWDLIKQNPAWSEEDETVLNGIIGYLCTHDSCKLEGFDKWYDFLKSLKDRVQPQPKQEWSEEDNQYLCGLIGLIEQSKAELPITLKGKAADNCINWLKSLRPQKKEALPQWRRLPLNGVSYAPGYWCVMDVITSTVGANSASVSALVKGDYYVPLFELEKFIRNI